jgi:hypothetical protein
MKFINYLAFVFVAITLTPKKIWAQDLALGKPITATSTIGSTNSADKASDGAYNTFWATWTSNVNPSITVSLGQVYQISFIDLQLYNVKGYIVQGSNGGTTYTQIASVSLSSSVPYQTHQFTSTAYTHIRIIITAYFAGSAPYGIYELGVYSTPPPPATTIDKIQSSGTGPLIINLQNNVAIGNISPGTYKLAVEGKIGAREVNVLNTTPWPDYVFEKGYKLPTLDELSTYILIHKHLPNIPSADSVNKKGIDLGRMNTELLRKIEEITLYLIEQRQVSEKLAAEIQNLKNENIRLQNVLTQEGKSKK